MPFFRFLTKKKLVSCPYFVQYLKTHCFHAHILSKKRHIFKKRCALIFFFKFYMKKPPELSYPYLVQKHNSIKTTLYYGPKKSKGCLSWGKGWGVRRIGVGLEVKLFLQIFWNSTIYEWLEALAHIFCNIHR